MYPHPLEVIAMYPYPFGGRYEGPTISELAIAALPACGGDAKKALEAARLIHAESATEEKRQKAELEKLKEQVTAAQTRLRNLCNALNISHYQFCGLVVDDQGAARARAGGAAASVASAPWRHHLEGAGHRRGPQGAVRPQHEGQRVIDWATFARSLRVVRPEVIGYVHPLRMEYQWWRTAEDAWVVKLTGQSMLAAHVRRQNSAYDLHPSFRWEATMQVSHETNGARGFGTYWVARRCVLLERVLDRVVRGLKRRDVLYRLGVPNAGFTRPGEPLNP